MNWSGWFFFPHVVEVRDLLPGGSLGPRYATSARNLEAEVIDQQELVRNPDGEEVTSSTRVTVPIEANVPLGSLVTVWPGGAKERTATVLRVGRDENDPPLPSHEVLWLT